MAFKILHSFVVNLDKEVEKTETRTENGQEITVKTKVKEPVPHTIVFKEPTRREKQELSLFYGTSYNEALDKKLWPKILVVQKYLKDPTSPLSQNEDRNLSALYSQLDSLRNDHLRLSTLPESDEQKTKLKEVTMQYIAVRQRAEDIESAYSSLFAHTAENYAQDQAIQWEIFNLFYLQTGDKYEPLFKGANFEEKQTYMFDLEDKNDELYFASINKMSLYAGLYFMGRAVTPDDFKKLEEELAKQLAIKADETKPVTP
jgi:hypothetical protein